MVNLQFTNEEKQRTARVLRTVLFQGMSKGDSNAIDETIEFIIAIYTTLD
jgi:hypothetical protein